MNNHEQSAWDLIDNQSSGIIGQFLKCAKGLWTLDGEEIETGDDGVKVVVLMESAAVGWVLWRDQLIVDKDIGRISDGFVPRYQAPEGWSPYTAITCIRADEGSQGQFCTFTSTSWGGKKALNALISQYRLMKRMRFPVCTLTTKPRGDANGNIDPVFKVVSWSDRENFAEICPIEPPALAAPPDPAFLPNKAQVKPGAGAIVNDEIPFDKA